MSIAIVLSLMVPGSAEAASCEYLIKRASSGNSGAVAGVYGEMVKCDKKLAEERFSDFMRASGDVGDLVALSKVAIGSEIYQPVWSMLEDVTDYSARDEVARGVGAHCASDETILPFLQGAYFGLGDRQFGQWREAFNTCETAQFDAWLVEVVGQPPTITYDEKYSTVVGALVKRRKMEALPLLVGAAVAAGNSGGPFNTIVDKMNDAARPDGFGASMSDEAKASLETSLSQVAQGVPAEQARVVADRLYQAGAEGAAAALLPAVYPDRMQGGGKMLYGVAAVESCGGEATLHYATVSEPATRWSIQSDVEAPARAFKPRLKCESDEVWPVLVTPEPMASKGEVDTWAQGIVDSWSGDEKVVKSREEKAITLD
jgi:hypothetical protein